MRQGLSQNTQLKQELKINPRLYQAMDLLYMPLLDLQQHLGGLQGIAADLEEVVIHADVGALQQSLPDLGDQDLQRRGRRRRVPLGVGEIGGESWP